VQQDPPGLKYCLSGTVVRSTLITFLGHQQATIGLPKKTPDQNTKLISCKRALIGQVIVLQVSMKLEMKDSPGQLVAALRPISDVGGNIIAVIHHREPGSRDDTLNVQIVLELPERRLDDLVGLLQSEGVHIQRIGRERLLYRRTVILIGHLMHTDLSDTIDRIDSTGFAEVSELSMSMPAINERSSSRLIIKSVTKGDMEKAIGILRRVSEEKDLLLIEPLEEMA